MLKHILFMQFTPAARAVGLEQVLAVMRQSIAHMVVEIDGFEEAELGQNVAEGSPYDFVYYTVFRDQEALRNYAVHPLHLAHQEKTKAWVTGRLVCDYWLEEAVCR